MKSPKRVHPMETYIRSVMSLDCANLPTKTAESMYHTSLNRPTMVKVATVASIRSLLVTFGELVHHLNSICKVSEMKPYYEYRRSLIDRVIRESLLAFEHCRDTLKLRGATQSPMAMKLASLANDVCDRVDLIKEKVNLALEWYEIRYKVLGDIQKFAEEKLTKSGVEPLLFSLNVVLPTRLETFAKAAATPFPEEAKRLQKMCSDVTDSLKHRVEALKDDKEVKPAVAAKSGNSAVTRPVKVLRGITCKQRLSGAYERVVLYKDAPEIVLKERTPAQHNVDPTSDHAASDHAASDPVSNHLTLKHPKAKHLTLDHLVMKHPVSGPVSGPVLNPVSDLGNHKEQIGANQGDQKENISLPKTRIKPPTKIVNKRPANPVKSTEHHPELKPRQSSASLSSRIARPTMLTAKPSVSNLRSTSWQAPKILAQTTSTESPSIESTLSLSSSPDCSMEETPLTRRCGKIGLQRRSYEDIKFPRQRSLMRSIRT